MRKHFILFLFLTIPLFLSAQITKPGYKPPVKKAAPIYNGPKKFTGKSKIIVEIDSDGTLSVDYEKIWDFKKGDVWKSDIAAGEHRVQLSNGSVTWKETVVSKSGQQLIVETNLKQQIASDRQVAARAEEQRQKEERNAEAKRKASIRAEEAKKRADDYYYAGNYRLAEEVYQKAIDDGYNSDLIATQLLKIATNMYQQYRTFGDSYFASKEYDDAQAAYQKALEYAKNDPYVTGKLTSIANLKARFVLNEDFSSSRTKLRIEDNREFRSSIQAGMYLVQPKGQKPVSLFKNISYDHTRNFKIQLDFKVTGTGQTDGIGVMSCFVPSSEKYNFSCAVVNSGIVFVANGEVVMGPRTNMRKYQFNKLMVEKKGGSLSYYLNGSLIKRINGSSVKVQQTNVSMIDMMEGNVPKGTTASCNNHRTDVAAVTGAVYFDNIIIEYTD